MTYQDLIELYPKQWHDYTQHEFVQKLFNQSLPTENFRHYLLQDYAFLKTAAEYFVVLENSIKDPKQQKVLEQYKDLFALEIPHHTDYFIEYGFTEQDFENITLAQGSQNYLDFLRQASQTGQALDYFIALSPCVIGYAQIGKNRNTQDTPKPHRYQSWIEIYSAESYQTQATQIEHTLNQAFALLSPAQKAKVQQRFKTACELEIGFWAQSMPLTEAVDA
jgi:thiaminase/transcriptional activator TenA